MHVEISETAVLAAAHSFVSLGLRKAGYEYAEYRQRSHYLLLFFLFPLSISTTPQDCWSLCNRHPGTNELVPDPVKFPRGIKALADDIHALGLKIGIYRQIVFAVLIWHSNREYSDAGTKTCAGYPGSLGYEATDAATWGSWNIDL